MAISGGDGSIILTTKVDETGLKKGLGSIKKLGATAGKAFLAIGAAAATATVAITKMAVSAYADYEQLVGGVETLFKGSAQKVIDYANDAFYTAGVSANEYMQQVTSFSASLLNSLAGDTDKAADVANMALIDISDNANKMGSSLESVTLAYQGFAKGQYMLLDNLKLGYGGTKTEMERLLKDAEAYLATQGKTAKFSIDNLADVYTAINAIQKKLDIAGTTAKEAEKTIAGSANMMKSAWQNVLTAISGGGDLDRAIHNLVFSVSKYFENIVPVVQRSLMGIGSLIEQIAPMLVQNVASALIQSIPNLINAVYQMIVGLLKGIWEGIAALFTGKTSTIQPILTTVGGVQETANGAADGMENLGDATEKAGKQAKKSLAAFDDLQILTSNIQQSTAVPNLGIQNVSVSPIEISTESFTNGLDNVTSIFDGLASNPFFEKLKELIQLVKDSKIFELIDNIDWDKIIEKLDKIKPLVESTSNFAKLIFDAMNNLTLKIMWDDLEKNINNINLAFEGLESLLNGDFKTTWNAVAKIFGFKQFDDGKEKVEKATTAIDNFNKGTDTFLTFWETNIPEWFNGYVVPYFADGKWKENYGKIINSTWTFFTGEKGFINTWNIELGKWWESAVHPWFLDVKWAELFKHVPRTLGDVLGGAGGLWAVWKKSSDEWMKEVGTLFTVEKWSNIFGNVKVAFGTIWDEEDGIIYKWRTGITKFWDEEVVPFFTETKWEDLSTNIADGIWKGVKSIPSLFVEMINGILTGFEKLSQGIVWGLNSFIDGYNNAAEPLGIKKINRLSAVDLSKYKLKVPKLATGAVLPPNKPFMAVVGDQKHGTNIEAPLDTIVEAMNIALSQNGGGGRNTEVVLEIDGREFGRAVIEQGNKENRRIGTRLVMV